MKFKAVLLALLMMMVTISPAYGDCERYNLDYLFFEEYDGSHWDNSEGNIKIVWSANVPEIEGETVTKPLTRTQLEWARLAFKSWDDALSTVSFVESKSFGYYDVAIGFTEIKGSGKNTLANWNAWDSRDGTRQEASIMLKNTEARWFNNKSQFIQTVQQEIGNVLGLGDLRKSSDYVSVMEDPMQIVPGKISLGDFDTGLVRQLYGECD
jgi:hypothetical protein